MQLVKVTLFNLPYSPVASQIMAKYGWKDGQGNFMFFVFWCCLLLLFANCLHLGMNFVVTQRRQFLDEMKIIIFGKRSDGF